MMRAAQDGGSSGRSGGDGSAVGDNEAGGGRDNRAFDLDHDPGHDDRQQQQRGYPDENEDYDSETSPTDVDSHAGPNPDADADADAELSHLAEQLSLEKRVHYGAAKFLESLNTPESRVPLANKEDLRTKVNAELEICGKKIEGLERKMREVERRRRGMDDDNNDGLEQEREPYAGDVETVPDTQAQERERRESTLRPVLDEGLISPLSIRPLGGGGNGFALSSPNRDQTPSPGRERPSAKVNLSRQHSTTVTGSSPQGEQQQQKQQSSFYHYPSSQYTTPSAQTRERDEYFSSPGSGSTSAHGSGSNQRRYRQEQEQGTTIQLGQGEFSPSAGAGHPRSTITKSQGNRIQRFASSSTLASSISGSVQGRSKSFGEDMVFRESGEGGNVHMVPPQPVFETYLDPKHHEGVETASNATAMDDASTSAAEHLLFPLRIETADPVVVQSAMDAARTAMNQLRDMNLEQRMGSAPPVGKVAKSVFGLTLAIKHHEPIKYELDFDEMVRYTQASLAEPADWRMRTALFRLYRCAMQDRQSWRPLRKAGIEYLLTRAFTRTNRRYAELEEAIKLLRQYMILPDGDKKEERVFEETGPSETFLGKQVDRPALAEPLVRILSSIAENPEDPLQPVCLETLTELALIDLPSVVEADAVRVLLQAIDQGPYDLTWGISAALLSILDSPRTRDVLPSEMGIEVILSGFTQVYGKGANFLDRLRASSRNVGLLLQSWSGLFSACQNDMRSIRSIVDALKVPVTETREVILDLLVSAFKIPTPQWYHPLIDSKTLSGAADPSISMRMPEPPINDHTNKSGPVHQYLAILVAVFVQAGLLESLTALLEEAPAGLTRKATLLLGEFLKLASRSLPFKYAARVQALPRLFELASESPHPQEKVTALSALSSIYRLSRKRESALSEDSNPIDTHSRMRSDSALDPVQRGQQQMERTRIALAVGMDDRHFQSLLVDCQVLYTKDYTKWNYAMLMELIEGPLLNTRRLEEAFKASKFGRRVLSFFHPFNRRFADIKMTRANRKWIKLGTTLVETLLSSEDGIKILQENKLLRQLAESFAELDQYVGGQSSSQVFFSKNRMETTLSIGYFEMLGALSKRSQGIQLLEGFNMFTKFYQVCDRRSREDLIKAIIENLDYSMDGHARIVLSKALTSSGMHTRIFATHHLGNLMHRDGATTWILQLLTTQLYDTSREVAEIAAKYLQVACESDETLKTVVQLQPALDHLGEVGQSLLMRFLSTSDGFSHLLQSGYIERELDEWFIHGNLQYVIHVETCLSAVFAHIPGDEMTRKNYQDNPLNLYGELAKTDEGCRILREKGHYFEYASFIREHCNESLDPIIIHQLKSAVWAVGHIGSTEGGVPILEDDEIVEYIVDLAEQSAVLSVRGTCYFVLGLIASTLQGSDLLEDFGWLSATDVAGRLMGICVPDDLWDFIQMPARSEPELELELEHLTPALPDPIESRILADISDLGNYVLATQAMRSLARVRSKHRSAFSSVRLYYRAIRLINHAHFKQPVRTFVCDMFDVKLDAKTLWALREEEDRFEEQQRDLREKKIQRSGRSDEDVMKKGKMDGRGHGHGRKKSGGRDARPSRLSTIDRESNVGKDKDVLQPKMKIRGFGDFVAE